MMRWMVGALVVMGCGYLGLSYVRITQVRIKQMAVTEQMLCQLEFAMVYLAEPFAKGLKAVAESYKGVPGTLFLTVAERIRKTPGVPPEIAYLDAETETEGLCFKQEEREILREFFRHAGRGDKENTKDAIRMTVARMQSLRECVEIQEKKDRKMWRSMGFLGGLFIVLLLL